MLHLIVGFLQRKGVLEILRFITCIFHRHDHKAFYMGEYSYKVTVSHV